MLTEKINEVTEKLKEKEAALVVEAEVSNNKDEENKKIVNRLKKQVNYYTVYTTTNDSDTDCIVIIHV